MLYKFDFPLMDTVESRFDIYIEADILPTKAELEEFLIQQAIKERDSTFQPFSQCHEFLMRLENHKYPYEKSGKLERGFNYETFIDLKDRTIRFRISIIRPFQLTPA